MHLDKPTDMAITPDGEIFVSDGYGNNHVHVFTEEGDHKFTFGGAGSGPGEFSTPHSITIDGAQRVYEVQVPRPNQGSAVVVDGRPLADARAVDQGAGADLGGLLREGALLRAASRQRKHRPAAPAAS